MGSGNSRNLPVEVAHRATQFPPVASYLAIGASGILIERKNPRLKGAGQELFEAIAEHPAAFTVRYYPQSETDLSDRYGGQIEVGRVFGIQPGEHRCRRR